MPAIHPPRLKIQASELVQSAPEPDVFCRSFHEFLDIYADRTFRPGRVGEPPPLLRTYQVPKPVSRALEKELGLWANDNRKEALNLADALWQQSFLEFRMTAATLLGQVDPLPEGPIFRRVENWIQPNTEERLVAALINRGLERILSESQQRYIKQVDSWLGSRKIDRNHLGLKASKPLIDQRGFDDFPLIFKRLNKLMRLQNNPLRNDLVRVLESLAHQAPEETAFFLETALRTTADNQQIAWYIRKCLSHFPAEIRSHLRNTLVA